MRAVVTTLAVRISQCAAVTGLHPLKQNQSSGRRCLRQTEGEVHPAQVAWKGGLSHDWDQESPLASS